MNVSIIIPTLNESEYIKSLLDSLQQQSYSVHEILVVDGGSSDNTCAIAKEYKKVQCISAHKPVGNQRTIGGNKATGEILIFLDADVIVKKDFVAQVIREMKQRSLDVACPKYIPYPGTVLINLFYKIFNMLFAAVQKSKPSGAGSCICVKKSIFATVQGFNARMHFDDIVFIRKAGSCGVFGILNTSVLVSDRRFRTYGFLQTCITYGLLSVLFGLGLYETANKVPYVFGKFSLIKEKKV